MNPDIMGRVLTEARIENLKDLWAVEQGLRTADEARSVVVTDALVDTGATLLSLPTALIQSVWGWRSCHEAGAEQPRKWRGEYV